MRQGTPPPTQDDSIIFKSQILPKEMEEIWLEVFNYINMIVNILKPTKMIVMALDGVAPRSKMNNQRARRFKSSRDHKRFMQQLYDFQGESESQENFKNNSISPGTKGGLDFLFAAGGPGESSQNPPNAWGGLGPVPAGDG